MTDIDTTINNSSEGKTLLDVFIAAMNKTSEKIKVATLAFIENEVKEFDGTYGILKVKPFPILNDEIQYYINAYYFTDIEDKTAGKIVCVLFMDRDFRNNLDSTTYLKTNNTILHTMNYGVIIKI